MPNQSSQLYDLHDSKYMFTFCPTSELNKTGCWLSHCTKLQNKTKHNFYNLKYQNVVTYVRNKMRPQPIVFLQ